MTHGYELKGGNVGGRGCVGWRGIKRGRWDNCNSIINKIYLKIKIKIKKDFLFIFNLWHFDYDVFWCGPLWVQLIWDS